MSPEADKRDPLDRLDVRIVVLRLGYDIFRAVERHLSELFKADVGDTGSSYVGVIRQISKECLEELQLSPIRQPEAYVDPIQNGFRAALYKLEAPTQDLLDVAQRIPSAMRIHSAAECRAGFEAMNLQAWGWFQNLILLRGGVQSRARLEEMMTGEPARLDIAVGQQEFTYCHYLRDTNQIRLLAGSGRSSLNLFFDLPFYFLHEYVSHAYARWDDDRWRFSEAYLLRVAHDFLAEKLRNEDRARRSFLGLNFEALRTKCDPRSESDLKKAEDCFAELQDMAGDPLVTHLLEWATLPANDTERIARSTLLSGFHALAKDTPAVETVFAGPSDGFEPVHRRLVSEVNRILMLRKLTL